ncbi:MAG: hypothetical protein KBC95_04365 [Candidatus Peribacteraceae bacterium]|nr:hypothetical protein [Candidatus Peribacteraceae bacterium]
MTAVDLVLALTGIVLVLLAWAGIRHLVSGVPFVPSPSAAVGIALDALELKPGDVFCDLGAGDGRVLAAATRRVPGLAARGCEAVWPVWLLGKISLLFSRTPALLHWNDARREPVSDVTALFLYLTPVLLKELAPKLRAELPPGARIASVTFRLPGFEPVADLPVPTMRGGQRVWLYRL